MRTTPIEVRLRPIAVDDSERFVAWRNSESVRSNFIFRADLSVTDQQRWVTEQVDTGKVAQFIIEVGGERMPVGSTFIRDIDRVHRRGEFGIFIGDEAMRGKGVGTEAAKLIIEHGFRALDLNKIFLRVLAHNVGAARSYENAGFVREGYLRQDVILDGRPTDVILMAVLREDWDQ